MLESLFRAVYSLIQCTMPRCSADGDTSVLGEEKGIAVVPFPLEKPECYYSNTLMKTKVSSI